MTEEIEKSPRRKLSVRTSLIAAALLGVGVAGGATAIYMTGPSIEMAPLQPVAIGSLKDDGSVVTLRGKVAEVYGSRFVLADASGKALVEAGPHESVSLVTAGAPVTVQGHFHDGVVRASFLVGADGKVTALRHGGGRHDRHGRGHDGRDRDAVSPAAPTAPTAPVATGNSAG